jgi:hypothetical protein
MVHQSAPPAFRQPVARDPGPAKHAHARTSQPCYFSISHAALAARELQEDVFQREVDISAEPLSLPLSGHRDMAGFPVASIASRMTRSRLSRAPIIALRKAVGSPTATDRQVGADRALSEMDMAL